MSTATADYIVVGGGAGGCAVAGRLTEDPDTSVTVLEAGGDGDSWVVKTPFAVVAMLPTKLNNWAFETVPQPGLNHRRGYQPRGKALGGSSAINAMVYIRGHRWDYDHWASLGNTGWSFDEVLPYFKRSENNASLGGALHGQSGPLHVSDLRSDNPFQQRYLEAARQAGFNINHDFNGEDQEGIGIYQVTQHQGERWSAARGYLHPHIGKRPNLSVQTGCHVTRILFEGKRAVGVEFIQHGQQRSLRARREILLAAGALQTPQILLLSGIGDGQALQALGIPVVHHLPGVGRNLQDHPDFVFKYRSKSTDLVGISLGGSAHLAKQAWRYKNERRGMITSNAAEGGGFLKTDPGLPAPDVQLHFVMAMIDDHARKLHLGHGYSCHVCLLRPKSVGELTLANADPLAAPLINPRFLEHPDDIETLLKGFKLTRKLMDAPALASMRSSDYQTANVKTDDDIRAALRQYSDTVYHPVGTCKMGIDEMAVVDPELRVHGLLGLRVVDASIMPTLIGGNTNAPTMMIGEKAADFLRKQVQQG
ncbi:GMC family oxidoreductase N-terminal domain-containing protein [Undibacterium sp. Jales W-56]|uniref:GMC family oxidoreductase n=1 Tax=Undibacterium sp. Jales W-56 TaxID=2897325 RepID=UPI0021CE6582|nr:GMC family oxidoreductase N-terminal domain-containing protein [Undibacterium sp. Jales W-56]MCU6434396.1 GMC family oxidoreductase N-terminal domain-containing protein [Undibacterium sp. Jales W-56]